MKSLLSVLILTIASCLLPIASHAQTQTHTSNLSWVAGAVNPNGDNAPTGFKVERKIGASGSYVQINTTGASVLTYQDVVAGDTGGVTYCYRVRAFNTVGDSAYTNEACGTSAIIQKAPNAPGGLKLSAVSSSQIRLSWQDRSDNETDFLAEMRGGGEANKTFLFDANQTTAIVGDLKPRTRYDVRMAALNDAGQSAWTNWARTKTPRN